MVSWIILLHAAQRAAAESSLLYTIFPVSYPRPASSVATHGLPCRPSGALQSRSPLPPIEKEEETQKIKIHCVWLGWPSTPPSPPTRTQTPLPPPSRPSSTTGASKVVPFGVGAAAAPCTLRGGAGDLHPLATIGPPLQLVPINVGEDPFKPVSSSHLGVVSTHRRGWGVL